MARLTKKARSQIEAHLAALPRERLVELLLDQVGADADLRDRLLLEAATAGGGPPDKATYRRMFADALRAGTTSRHRYPRTTGTWARGVHTAIAAFGELAAAGHAATVKDLTEYALGRVEVSLGRIDDSAGWFSGIVRDLEALHLAACTELRPDPKALAATLFAFETDSEWDILIDSARRYAEVLGPDGLAEMRRLATERWDSIDRSRWGPERRPDTGSFHLTRMLETLADLDGDLDGRVAVMAADLSYPMDYVEIAEVLDRGGRHDEALAWAEKGLAAFEDSDHHLRGDSRLDDVVLAGWLERDRRDEVDDLVWRRFAEAPELATYKRLEQWATGAGTWERREGEARELLDRVAAGRAERLAAQPARRSYGVGNGQNLPGSHDDLIAVLTWKGRLDEAWSLATEHGAALARWSELGDAREADHPLDSAAARAREVESLIDARKTWTYREAADRIARIRDLHLRADDPDGFAAYLADVRTRHQAKRKFMGFLDEAGLV